MPTGLQILGIPGPRRPLQSPHKPDWPNLVWAMCFDSIQGSASSDNVSIEGISAGSLCSIQEFPAAAHLNGQSTHLEIRPDPTEAILTGHSFTPEASSKGFILHLYHYFEEEWPVEDDFNFIELLQGGQVIFALRVTNEGGGQAGLYIQDADGTLTQVGAAGVITDLQRHFIQVWLSNSTNSDVVVDVDHTVEIDVPGNNFRNESGGPITVRIRNADSAPTSPTITHCCGGYVTIGEHDHKHIMTFETQDVVGIGRTISAISSFGECAPDGSIPGSILSDGTSADVRDWDIATKAEYIPNLGGAWAVADPEVLRLEPTSNRLGGVYNWLYSIEDNVSLGPATARLLLGSTKESPSDWDMDYVQVPHGAVSLAHHQEIVSADLSPLPNISEQMVIGFESLGTPNELQRVWLFEVLCVTIHRYLSVQGVLPNRAQGYGATRLTAVGGVTIRNGDGRVLLYNRRGGCINCCEDEEVAYALPTLTHPWDLTPYKYIGTRARCGFWAIDQPHENHQFLDAGLIDREGELIGLPDEYMPPYDCIGEANHLILIIRCGRDWPQHEDHPPV